MQDATYRGSEPKRWRKQVNLVLAQLDEKQRRLVAGLLSKADDSCCGTSVSP